ncbi:MAG: GH1 family beta-glucosidase [Bacillota bacterium]|nr:GH1 family beta-glucosidase [Bacillota bacterium]
MSFDKQFKWGAATASYQIEGGAYEDGKGLSIWDMFCKEPDKIYNGDTGDFACDSYHRIKEDVKIIKDLGIKIYRFSLSWTRILPKGIGKINEDGLKFYDMFIDELIKANIEPYITLFHWDYPYELYKKGHWLNDESSKWFENYTDVVVKRYGDRVKNWMTINEPQIFIGLGYLTGRHAPGLKLSRFDIIRMTHNVLLSHGKAVRKIREHVENASVGFAFVCDVGIPSTNSDEDKNAAREYTFNRQSKENDIKRYDFPFDNELWFDPVILGKYPNWVYENYSENLPKSLDEDLKIISENVDFMGLNIYHGKEVKNSDGGFEFVKLNQGHAVTGHNWNFTPDALYWGPYFMYERYKKPIMITENGLSNKDWVSIDGKVHDEGRIDFLKRYLIRLGDAIDDGINVTGYFQWSLLDNFEWAEGYKERFGLVYVDFLTGVRTKKESYYWYRDLINGKEELK